MDTDHKQTQVLLPNPIVPQQPTKMPTPPEALNHICNVCHKGFRSGQALGGHKSMHFRESEAIASAIATTSDLVCCLSCGMNFYSKEALFRHLRSHNQSLSPQGVYNSSSSSSTVSDHSDEAMFDDDGVDSGFDLSKTLPLGWSCTGKRKRTSSDFSGSDETAVDSSPGLELVTFDKKLEAEEFRGLLMLAEVCAEEASGRPLVDHDHVYDDEIEIRYVEIKCKRRRLNNEHETRWLATDRYDYNCNDIDEFRCKLCNKTFTSYQALGGHMTSHNRLKNNTADPDHDSFSFECKSEQHPHPHPVVNVYRCNNCDRTFSSFQALGGHKSSQCKDHVNNNTHSSADNSVVKDNNDPAEPRQDEVHRCHVCNKVFASYHALGGHVSSHSKNKNNNNVDQDQSNSADTSTGSAENKNERQKLYQTVPHQCKVCGTTFQTGQALGGHQRLHFKRPTQAPGKSSQQSSARKHLEIDLNEIPSMEDEDGIYEPSVILTLS
uniref:zinc finger protein ZAT4-like n=1 Tax=Fragaria vesca subsp. vesca TaxID=101020 RepID=UPI0005CAC079|nr:PREDICTED: zinc finger protein ZAT4-like [Fragaria vesca subsp. vesca]